MRLLPLNNPFGAPVYYEETVSSTFDAARLLAAGNEAHGTVITADFQEAGRGRQGRPWAVERGKALLFTILLRYADFPSIPAVLTLRTGLAVSLAVEDLLPALAGMVKVKWPNDIMIGSHEAPSVFGKAAGILTETDGKNVFIGVGVNVSQTDFPGEYRSRAVSLIRLSPGLCENARFILLEKILSRLYGEIEKNHEAVFPQNTAALRDSGRWREPLLKRLYMIGETVTFAEGAAGSTRLTAGTLSGIGPGGEILIIPKGEKEERAFLTGELRVY